jgi:ABC-type nitrate/sulfonate/bicarbonate transport system substrate-binding protein
MPDSLRRDDPPWQVSRRGLIRRALGAAVAAPPLLGVLGAACRSEPAPAAPAAPPPAAPAGSTGAATGVAAVTLAQRRPMKIAWTAVSGAMSGLWMAYETGAWRELGIDPDLIHVASSSRIASSMQANEIDAGMLDWAVAFQFVAQGGNAREIAGVTNRQIFSVMSVPSITRPEDVIGKRWGITRLGSSTHTASLLALEMWKIRPDQVQFLQLQEVPAILAGMEVGQVDVGAVSPPTNVRAVQAGFRELIDLAENGPEYPSVGLATLERYTSGAPEYVRAIVAGYAMGVARFRKDPERALAVLRQYLQVDDEAILRETHTRFSRYLAFPPLIPVDSLPRIKEDVSAIEPAVANVPIADVAAPRFAEELQTSGFYATLA